MLNLKKWIFSLFLVSGVTFLMGQVTPPEGEEVRDLSDWTELAPGHFTANDGTTVTVKRYRQGDKFMTAVPATYEEDFRRWGNNIKNLTYNPEDNWWSADPWVNWFIRDDIDGYYIWFLDQIINTDGSGESKKEWYHTNNQNTNMQFASNQPGILPDDARDLAGYETLAHDGTFNNTWIGNEFTLDVTDDTNNDGVIDYNEAIVGGNRHIATYIQNSNYEITDVFSTAGQRTDANIYSTGAIATTVNTTTVYQDGDEFYGRIMDVETNTMIDGAWRVKFIVNIASENQLPSISEATINIAEATTGSEDLVSLMNITDADGDVLSYSISVNGSAITASVTSEGVLNYTTANVAADTQNTITVSVTDGEATSTAVLTVNVITSMSVNEVEQTELKYVYIPSLKSFYTKGVLNAKCKIYDALGNLVLKGEVINGYILFLAKSNGVYYITTETEKGIYRQKVLVK